MDTRKYLTKIRLVGWLLFPIISSWIETAWVNNWLFLPAKQWAHCMFQTGTQSDEWQFCQAFFSSASQNNANSKEERSPLTVFMPFLLWRKWLWGLINLGLDVYFIDISYCKANLFQSKMTDMLNWILLWWTKKEKSTKSTSWVLYSPYLAMKYSLAFHRGFLVHCKRIFRQKGHIIEVWNSFFIQYNRGLTPFSKINVSLGTELISVLWGWRT